MKEISSLSQFFSEIACHFQCYNMGRRIYPVDPKTFIDFENTHATWQAPFLQHAWFALIFWKGKSWKEKSWKNKSREENNPSEHYVWFLKFPLDEQAKLNLAARDDFLARLFATLQNYLAHSQQAKHNNLPARLDFLESAMQDSPYGFQPKEQQLANFHAIVHTQLSLSASSYYKNVQDYLYKNVQDCLYKNAQDCLYNNAQDCLYKNAQGCLAGSNGFQNWHKLGFQGFADIAARLDERYKNTSKTNEQLVNEAIAHLPMEAYQVLAACLENHSVSKQTTQVIYRRLITELEKNHKSAALTQLCLSSIRASAQSSDKHLQTQLLSAVLKSAIKTDIEVLATISGRCWPLISHTKILPAFLEALAIADIHHTGAFSAILSDLMFIPGIRDTILPAFRLPNRSVQLTQAIGTLFCCKKSEIT